MNNFKLILIIITTFLITFATSLLLDFEIFKNPIRYVLVVLLIVFELIIGFMVLKHFISTHNPLK